MPFSIASIGSEKCPRSEPERLIGPHGASRLASQAAKLTAKPNPSAARRLQAACCGQQTPMAQASPPARNPSAANPMNAGHRKRVCSAAIQAAAGASQQSSATGLRLGPPSRGSPPLVVGHAPSKASTAKTARANPTAGASHGRTCPHAPAAAPRLQLMRTARAICDSRPAPAGPDAGGARMRAPAASAQPPGLRRAAAKQTNSPAAAKTGARPCAAWGRASCQATGPAAHAKAAAPRANWPIVAADGAKSKTGRRLHPGKSPRACRKSALDWPAPHPPAEPRARGSERAGRQGFPLPSRS